MLGSLRFAGLGWVGLFCALSTAEAGSWRVRVEGNGTALGETPVVVPLKAPVAPGNYYLVLDPKVEILDAQVFEEGEKSYLATVLRRVPAQGSVDYRLSAPFEPLHLEVELKREGENVSIRFGGILLADYQADSATKPYFFPVIGPTGAPITRAYPMKQVAGETKDHPHQRSFWFTHGKVNGVDFWASDPINRPKPNYGTIRETAKKTVLGGPALGLLRTTDDWLGPDGKKVCEDERVVRVYATTGTYAATGARVFDFDVTIKATNGPVTFGDTKEGTFGVRVASSMDVDPWKQGGKITNAEGLTDAAAWGKASPWVDYVGPVDGKTVGVAILNHPESFRYPTTWHVRTYGLFAANPFGWHDFGMKKSGEHVIPSGESISFRYRVVLHTGDTASADVPALFSAYATPPLVTVRAE